MYVVYKDIEDTLQRLGVRNNTVDALFNAITEEQVQHVVPDTTNTFIPIRTIRTRTIRYTKDAPLVNEIPKEKLILACNHILSICEQHPHPESEYIKFSIPKKTRGYREIDAPKPILKQHQTQLANILTYELNCLTHDSAWAYVKGRDVIGACQEHTKNKSRWYLKLDMKNFFGSMTPDFILEQLSELYPFSCYATQHDPELKATVTHALNELIRVASLNNGLPQGTPLSPLLTNLVMVSFDYRLNNVLAREAKARNSALLNQRYVYTRYADDLIISANKKFSCLAVVSLVQGLLHNTPLSLNKEKTRFGSNSGRNWNLGIMCNAHQNITIGYRKKQILKASVHNYIQHRPDWTYEELTYLLGQLSWMHNVEPAYAEGLDQYFKNKYGLNIKACLADDIKHSHR